MNNLIAKLTIYCLRSKRLSGKAKAKVTAALLDNVQSIPLQSVIYFDAQNTLHIGGKTLDYEQASLFVESAKALKENFARKVIHEQVSFEAVKMGLHQGLTPEMIQFAKAALWYNEQEEKLLAAIAE